MITIVSTHATRGTHKPAKQFPGIPKFTQRTYWSLFRRRSIPGGTYILTDFDRLGPWELELAAHFYQSIKAAGAAVLNDPGRFLSRHTMLEHLRRQGLNSFRAWSPVLGEFPDRFPVFLRTQAAHRGPKSDLLTDEAEARAALDAAVAEGHPLADLIFIEYCAAPEENDIFIKYSAYRIGDAIVPSISTMSLGWVAKIGDRACGKQDQYDQDYARIEDYPYTDQVMAIFEAVGLEYGRIDFGIVEGNIETYEINTNPWMGMPSEHPIPIRIKATELVRKKYADAMRQLDAMPAGERIRLDRPIFKDQRAHDGRRLFLTRWTP